MGYTPPYLDVRRVAGAYKVYAPSSTSGDDLWIYPNTTDAVSRIVLEGAGAIYLYGVHMTLQTSAGGDAEYRSATDKNIFINPQGTGNVKFGTYTAGAATDSTGYITILDAGGNTRKLMVQA